LNSLATAAIATVAGADPATAGRLALSMLAMQASIGALNDVVDAPLDAGRKPGKPIPRGVVSPRTAMLVAATTGLSGVALSAPSGAAALAAACGVIGLGYVYDLRLSRTGLSWLPLALALPVLPLHAWLGATGSVPSGLVALTPAAILAGASLSLGNALVDVERDAAAGRRGSAVVLGRRTAWVVQTVVLVLVLALAFVLAPEASAGAADVLAKQKEILLATQEIDGCWVDSHELGRVYGTAMALLTLKLCDAK